MHPSRLCCSNTPTIYFQQPAALYAIETPSRHTSDKVPCGGRGQALTEGLSKLRALAPRNHAKHQGRVRHDNRRSLRGQKKRRLRGCQGCAEEKMRARQQWRDVHATSNWRCLYRVALIPAATTMCGNRQIAIKASTSPPWPSAQARFEGRPALLPPMMVLPPPRSSHHTEIFPTRCVYLSCRQTQGSRPGNTRAVEQCKRQ